jgi:hypothetical protein
MNGLRKSVVICGHQTDFCKTFTDKKMTKSQPKNAELPFNAKKSQFLPQKYPVHLIGTVTTEYGAQGVLSLKTILVYQKDYAK